MVERIRNAIVIYDKYFMLYTTSPYYILAVLLDPRRRLEYFKDNSKQDWADKRELGENIWLKTKYPNGVPPPPKTPGRKKQSRHETDDPISAFATAFDGLSWRTGKRSEDEFSDFIESAQHQLSKGQTALSFWLDEAQRTRWPLLSKLARDILSIPAMSAEDERVFSGARRTLSWERSMMGPVLLNRLECLKYWSKTR